MGISLKSKAVSMAVSVLLVSCMCAPVALANEGKGGEPITLQAASALTTQAANTTQGTAKKITVGKSATGKFTPISRLDTREHWFKFTTTGKKSAYKIRLNSLSGKTAYFELRNKDGEIVKDSKGRGLTGKAGTATGTITTEKLAKGKTYWVRVYTYYNNSNGKFKISVKKS